VSPGVVGHWGSLYFRGRSSPCSAPYQRRTTNGGIETLYYCADCHIRAMVEIVEESNP